ncbi:MAG: ACT domain-containing protein [Planctomycetota bacterium]|nr:MAG: ACT domain-containing protein [Planctomycetota bacterium]
MKIRKQLSIFLANKPGALSRAGQALREANINILGITVSDAVDHAVVRFVVDKPEEAIKIFEERNILIIEGEVLEVLIPNTPGGFAELAAKLAEKQININYAYGSVLASDAQQGNIYLHVSDIESAKKILDS